MRRFPASWDRGLKLSTAAVALLLVVVGVGVPALALASGAEGPVSLALVLPTAIALLVTVGCAALAPRAFVIEGRALRVERPLLSVAIPLASIRAVAPLPPGAMRGALRLGGTSGYFGHYGRFRSPALGSFRMYATRRDGLVLVDTDRERFVLSPDRPDRFIDAVLAVAPGARRAEEIPAGDAAPKRSALRAVLLATVVTVGAFAAIGTLLAVAWARSPIAASVKEGAVVIERRGADPVAIPVGDVTGASLLPPEALRGARRTNGTSFGTVRYGRWRSPALGAFTFYAWRFGPYVLLELENGERVVLTPDEPEAFVKAIRAARAER